MIPRVHLISDARAPLGILGSIERALRAELPEPIAVHLRHQADDRELYRLGLELRALTRERGALLFINRRLDLALALGADGLHLPERGLLAHEARTLWGPRLIGVSRHDDRGILQGSQGADYAFLSPVAQVPGKNAPIGAARLLEIAARSPLPIVALGGLDAALLAQLRSDRPKNPAGVHGFAAMRSILHADEPDQALLSLYRVFIGSV